MRLDIRFRGGKVDPHLREYADRCLRFALGRFANRISTVNVWFDDLNGPRGGLDLRCLIYTTLVRHGELAVEAIGADAETATKLAGERMARRIRTVLGRGRSVKRRAARYVAESFVS